MAFLYPSFIFNKISSTKMIKLNIHIFPEAATRGAL